MRNRGVIKIQTLRRLCLKTHAIAGNSKKSGRLGANGTRMWTDLRRGKHQARVYIRDAISRGGLSHRAGLQ